MSLILCVFAVNSQWVLNRRCCWNSKRGAKPRTGRAREQPARRTASRRDEWVMMKGEKNKARHADQLPRSWLRKAAQSCKWLRGPGKRAMIERKREKEREKEREKGRESEGEGGWNRRQTQRQRGPSEWTGSRSVQNGSNNEDAPPDTEFESCLPLSEVVVGA